MQNFRYSEAGLALTKRYEGLRLKAYQDSGGIWTIGYGHTGAGAAPERVITPLEAEALLRADLRTAIDCVNRAVRVGLEQHQFDALVDFCFNAGSGSLLRSTLLRCVNAGAPLQAADLFNQWTHVNGQVSRGLQRRRAAEAAMFRGVYRANSIA